MVVRSRTMEVLSFHLECLHLCRGNGSSSKMLAVQASGSEFYSRAHIHKNQVWWCALVIPDREVETVDPWGSLARLI